MMIKKDQPKIFKQTGVIAAVSSIEDGTMKFDTTSDDVVFKNRQIFLANVGISIDQATTVKVVYDTSDFAKYKIVTRNNDSDEVGCADALVVDEPNHALFLPLADCVGAVIYDPIRKVLMVSHLGRHSTEVDGGVESVKFLQGHYNADPSDLLVWLSPAVGGDSYPLRVFENKALHEVLLSQFTKAGVCESNIEVSSVDTATDENYYSHSEFLKDQTQPFGRFAIVAMMREQGEPAS